MKLFKRLVALLVVALLLIGCATNNGNGNNNEEPNNGNGNNKGPTAGGDTLVVAASDLNGDYVNGFSNTTYDVWIKNLIHGGYEVYTTDEGGQFVLNQTANAQDPEVTENEDGSKTFHFFLADNLTWSDGTPITAKDYVFSVLFADSPEWLNAGAGTAAGDGLVGYEAYHDGSSSTFPGIKYISDTEFEATIDASMLPYFYETAYIAFGPTPMHRYTPNLTIGEDGSSLTTVEGYELTDQDKADFTARVDEEIEAVEETIAALEAGIETAKADLEEADEDKAAELEAKIAADEKKVVDAEAEIAELEEEKAAVDTADVTNLLLQSGAYDVAQTFRYAPDVTAGAYKFVSFENNAATVELNPEFKGDAFGKTPTIPRVVVRSVNQTLDVDLAINGEVDIVQGVIEEDKIEKAVASDQVGIQVYSRNGYGLIAFHVDYGATQHKEVRQAVAYLIDRNEFVQNILGGYGVIGQGEYGLAQWMYAERGLELEEAVHNYALDYDKANELLDASPYKFEADGTTPWDAAKGAELAETEGESFTYWRHDAEGNQLLINHFGTVDNNVTDLINIQLPPNGRVVGLEYSLTYGDFATLIEHYYNASDSRDYTAFNLATNFTAVYDPFYSYHSSFYGNPNYNTNGVNDPELDVLIETMRNLNSDQVDEYADAWLEYQIYWNDLLPNVPLYSNEYRDVYNVRVQGLESTPVWDWSNDIADLTLGS